jgi:hypothetical protein
VGNLNAYVNGTLVSFNKPSVKRTMRLPMSRQLRVVSELIRREIFTKEELDVPVSYLKIFK